MKSVCKVQQKPCITVRFLLLGHLIKDVAYEPPGFVPWDECWKLWIMNKTFLKAGIQFGPQVTLIFFFFFCYSEGTLGLLQRNSVQHFASCSCSRALSTPEAWQVYQLKGNKRKTKTSCQHRSPCPEHWLMERLFPGSSIHLQSKKQAYGLLVMYYCSITVSCQ